MQHLPETANKQARDFGTSTRNLVVKSDSQYVKCCSNPVSHLQTHIDQYILAPMSTGFSRDPERERPSGKYKSDSNAQNWPLLFIGPTPSAARQHHQQQPQSPQSPPAPDDNDHLHQQHLAPPSPAPQDDSVWHHHHQQCRRPHQLLQQRPSAGQHHQQA